MIAYFVLFWLFFRISIIFSKRFIIIPNTNQTDVQLLHKILSE